MLSHPFGRLALASALGVFAWPVHAEPLTLQAAIGRTLASNPSLRAEGAAVTAYEQQLQLDGLAPALTLGAELENIGGTGAVSNTGGAETTLRLGKVFELGGKRAARQQRGLAEIARQENVVTRRRLDLAAETTKRFIAVVETQDELALAERQVALTQETEAAVQQRVDRGVSPAGDVALAQIAVARAELAREHAEHELESSRFALVALWGEVAPRPIDATAELLTLPDLPAFESLAERLTRTPEAVAYTLDTAKLDADRGVAQAAARPDLALTAGVRRLEAIDDQALVFSFSMPLGSSHRSGHAVGRIDAELEAVAARRDAAMLEARQLLFARYQELRHARTEVQSLTDRMIPAADRGLSLTRAGYDDARYSILQLTQAQNTLLQLQQERLVAAARYHTLLAEIERSTADAGATP